MNKAATHTTTETGPLLWPAFSVVAVRARVMATGPFVQALLGLDACCRMLFNAAVDPRVPFADGVAHGIAASAARRAGLPEPPRPAGGERLLPVPRPHALYKELTALRALHPWLDGYAVAPQRKALAQACAARQRHVEDCVAAKAAGRKPPRVPRRRARDGCTVTSDAFTLERAADGPPQPGARRRPGPNTEANRARRERRRERAEAAWAQARLDAGRPANLVSIELARRLDRRERARERQARAQADWLAWQRPVQPCPRSDSPLAVVGHDRLMLTIKPLPQVRIRLDRPLPKGAEVVDVHLAKAWGHDARVEAVLTLRVPFTIPRLDPAVTGAAIHAAVRHLSPAAPALAYVAAAAAAGIPCVGEDSNIVAPSATSDGRTTRPVRRDRAEVERLKDLDRQASRKREAWLARQPKPVPVPADLVGPVRPGRPPRYVPSERAREVDRKRRKIHRRWSDTSRTRACQDARPLVEGMALVATDPARMVAPLLARGGPADRRDARARLGLAPDAPLADASATAVMRPSAKRAMRNNLHRTRVALRIERTGILCGAADAIHATPGHEHTTQDCPGCGARRRKAIGERNHACPDCGLAMPRDRASATMNLGNALRAFREGPDPGGRIAAAVAGRLEALAKAEKTRERRREGGQARKGGSAGVPPAGEQGVVCPVRPGSPGAEHQERDAPSVNGGAIQAETPLTTSALEAAEKKYVDGLTGDKGASTTSAPLASTASANQTQAATAGNQNATVSRAYLESGDVADTYPKASRNRFAT